MPEKWVSAELLMHYKGVDIYHAYKDGCDERLTYWYDLSPDGEAEFDIRDVETTLAEKGVVVREDPYRDEILMLAVDNGVLKPAGAPRNGSPAAEGKCLKAAVLLYLQEMLDLPGKVLGGMARTAARAIRARLKREHRPYWTGDDLAREVYGVLRQAIGAYNAQYPKFLRSLGKQLDACLAAGVNGELDPFALSEIARVVHAKLRSSRASTGE